MKMNSTKIPLISGVGAAIVMFAGTRSFIWAVIGGIMTFVMVSRMEAKRQARKNALQDVINVENEPLPVISPQIRHAMSKYSGSVESVAELKQLGTKELHELLSSAAKILEIFENRVIRIADANNVLYVEDRDFKPMFSIWGAIIPPLREWEKNAAKKQAEKKLAPVRAQLGNQLEKAEIMFKEESSSEGLKALNAIPKTYTHSVILEMMCGYLADGEADNWQDCVKTFKEDFHRLQQNAYFNEFLEKLTTIEENTTATARNTGITAFFSGITALNTGRIAAKL